MKEKLRWHGKCYSYIIIRYYIRFGYKIQSANFLNVFTPFLIARLLSSLFYHKSYWSWKSKNFYYFKRWWRKKTCIIVNCFALNLKLIFKKEWLLGWQFMILLIKFRYFHILNTIKITHVAMLYFIFYTKGIYLLIFSYFVFCLYKWLYFHSQMCEVNNCIIIYLC